jgi:biopolymer transport protein ExbD
MKLRRTRSGRAGSDEGSILPLINVVFLLLIFFMVVGSLSAADPFAIQPPRSISGNAGDPRDIVLLVAVDGRLALDGAVIDPAALRQAIENRLATATVREVHVKADGASEAAAVVGIMETLRGAGTERIRLMTVSGTE